MSDEDARERQMKRQSESPLPPFGFEHSSSVDPSMKATSADDAFKLRVTVSRWCGDIETRLLFRPQ